MYKNTEHAILDIDTWMWISEHVDQLGMKMNCDCQKNSYCCAVVEFQKFNKTLRQITMKNTKAITVPFI